MNPIDLTTRPTSARRWWPTAGAYFGLLLLLLPVLATAQRLPADVELQAFSPSSDYELKVDGQPVAKAKLYHSQRAAAYLITKAFDSPILIRQRGGTIERVHIMKVARRDNGGVDLLEGAVYASAGRFRIEGETIAFTLDGAEAKLVPRPPLIGWHPAAEVLEHSPEYGVKAETYTPTAGLVASLQKQQKNVVVKVFFGSWCSVCKRYLPLGLKLEESLGEASKVRFEYYGLPKPPKAWIDPEAKKAAVEAVPTAIVYVEGKEAGRIKNNGWRKPEQTLAQIVKDAS